jgi:type II secretory pathway component PulJ
VGKNSNAAGQALIEVLILLSLFMLILLPVAKKLPVTLSSSTPYLSGQVENRLQTGNGFSRTFGQGTWSPPYVPKGGVHD